MLLLPRIFLQASSKIRFRARGLCDSDTSAERKQELQLVAADYVCEHSPGIRTNTLTNTDTHLMPWSGDAMGAALGLQRRALVMKLAVQMHRPCQTRKIL